MALYSTSSLESAIADVIEHWVRVSENLDSLPPLLVNGLNQLLIGLESMWVGVSKVCPSHTSRERVVRDHWGQVIFAFKEFIGYKPDMFRNFMPFGGGLFL